PCTVSLIAHYLWSRWPRSRARKTRYRAFYLLKPGSLCDREAARQRYPPPAKGRAPALPYINERPRASATFHQRKAARQRYVSSANFNRSTVFWTLPRPSASAQFAGALYNNIPKVP
uniref:Secreted protein n=1 Tax=Bursaphelenchus xylophilus TaxID=6326 RepID=A0A1I7SKQ9_BURXY